MNIFNWFGKKNRSGWIEKSSLRLEIEDLELNLGISHYSDDNDEYLYESEEYLGKLKESRDKVQYLTNKFPGITIFLQNPSSMIEINFDEFEEEIIRDNQSRDIILDDLGKLRNGDIKYKDIHFEDIRYINSDFSCFLESIISGLVGKKIKLPEYEELKYSQFYINNYRIKELDNFPRIGPVWIGNKTK